MPRRSTTVRDLSVEFEMDLDEALVTLWDAGFEDVLDIDSTIPARQAVRARQSLGLSPVREMRTVAYWRAELGLDAEEFEARLGKMGVSLSASARVLPKGALAKLRRAARESPAIPAERPQSISVARGSAGSQEAEPPFEWRIAGSSRQCQQVSLEEVCQIHSQLEEEFAAAADPILPPGVRDAGLLESAVHRPETSLGGQLKYESAEGAAAALLHSLTHNHPFFNGNKRTALVSALVSLDRNNILLTCSEDEVFRFVLRVAQHRIVPIGWSHRADREVMTIADWIFKNSRAIERGERLIKWRELRKILMRFDCRLEGPLPGNKMKIRRTVTKTGFLGLRSRRELIAHAWYADEGREIAQDHLHYLRHELELDDQSGYDSVYFYGTDSREPDEFIAKYQNILRRLARL
jgi:death-on-curing family protein